jgi:hypothetical protein
VSDSFVPDSPIGVIGACWYLEPEHFISHSDRFLTKAIGRRHSVRRYVAMKESVVVREGSADSVASNWLVGGGIFLDVSAYAQACSTLPDNLSLYLVFNDTLFTKHPWRLISKRLACVRESLATLPAPAAAAEVHPSTDLLLTDPRNSSRHHLSTFCLMLNNDGFNLFRQLLAELPASAERETVQNWIDTRVANYPALKALLHVHLYGPRTPWSWKHSHPELLQRKAVTVIFEYIFTAELLSAGIGMPINQGFGYRLLSRLGRHG